MDPILHPDISQFILHPIRYPKVRSTSRIWSRTNTDPVPCSYGRCTRPPRRLSGLLKKSTFPTMSLIGVACAPKNASSYPSSWPSLRRQMALLTRILWNDSAQKCKYPKLDASTQHLQEQISEYDAREIIMEAVALEKSFFKGTSAPTNVHHTQNLNRDV